MDALKNLLRGLLGSGPEAAASSEGHAIDPETAAAVATALHLHLSSGSGLSPEAAAAVGFALHFHLAGPRRQVAGPRAPSGSGAWVLAGRVRSMEARSRAFLRR